ncbi:MAG: N-acetyltransferase [Deltaproteobacteria bacterium]|jgi:acetyltransferase-like isoleucine patch superfamily enzyme|nr:N-acetyltransferase [Deltaproteobacteria bacterium]
MSSFIHNTAHIADNVQIGEDTKIWINTQVRENVKIGRNCNIGKDCYIDHGVIIGDNVKIQNGVSVYNGVTIENDVFVGPNVVFTNDYYPRATNSDWEIKKTLIKRGASLGANSTIVCSHIIGKYAMVGAGSVITHDVSPYSMVVGNPAKQIGNVCTCGHPIKNNLCTKCGKFFNINSIKDINE